MLLAMFVLFLFLATLYWRQLPAVLPTPRSVTNPDLARERIDLTLPTIPEIDDAASLAMNRHRVAGERRARGAHMGGYDISVRLPGLHSGDCASLGDTAQPTEILMSELLRLGRRRRRRRGRGKVDGGSLRLSRRFGAVAKSTEKTVSPTSRDSRLGLRKKSRAKSVNISEPSRGISGLAVLFLHGLCIGEFSTVLLLLLFSSTHTHHHTKELGEFHR